MKYIGIGDNVVDRYINKRIMFPGGNAVNFAAFVKECGGESSYMGVIASDPEGNLIKASLSELGVDISNCIFTDNTGTERCDVDLKDGDRVFVGSDYGGQDHRSLTLDDEKVKILQSYDVIHCGCYADMEDQMEKLQGQSGIITYDFSEEDEYRTDEYLEKVCPFIDIALFSGADNSQDEIDGLIQKCSSLGTDIIMVTRGKAGQTLFLKEKPYKGKVKEVEPVDTMGAGDSFFAGFVVTLMNNGLKKNKFPSDDDIEKAFDFASEYSAKNCLREGAFGFGTKY